MYSHIEQYVYFHPELPSAMFVTVKNGYIQEKTPSDERLRMYDWLKQRFQTNRNYLRNEHSTWLQVRDALLSHIQEVVEQLDEMDAAQLAEQYQQIILQAIDSVRWGVMLENSDEYGEQVLPKKIEQALPNVTASKRNEILLTLSAPPIVSFMEEYHVAGNKLVLEHKEELSNDQSPAVSTLCDAYTWITVNYGGSAALTPKQLLLELQKRANVPEEKLKAEIEEIASKVARLQARQQLLLEEFELSQDILDDFEILRTLGAWMDERKESMVRTSYAIQRMLTRASTLTGYSVAQLNWYTYPELIELLKSGTSIDEEVLQARQRNCVIGVEPNQKGGSEATLFVGEEASELYTLLNNDIHNMLQGVVASVGKSGDASFSGTANIVLDVTIDPLEEGNILVTSMTRPEFVPLMKKASAIITDEGGITCHAAVVSRELGIPCIIGTKHATKILQNNQTVIMDLEHGWVRKQETHV